MALTLIGVKLLEIRVKRLGSRKTSAVFDYLDNALIKRAAFAHRDLIISS